MTRAFSAFLILFTILVSCKGKSDEKAAPIKERPPLSGPIFTGGTPEDQVKNTILRYNDLLASGYRNLNMTPLREVATEEVAQKAYYHMAALGEGKTRLESTLKKITFEEVVSQETKKFRVDTKEIWDFAHVDMKTGTRGNEQKDFVYQVTYTLENQDGRWLITTVSAVGDEPAEKAATKQKPSGGEPARKGQK